MKDVFVLLAHFLTTLARLLGPGGTRAVMAESLLVKQQLLIVTRSRQRAPNLTVLDRFLLGFWTFFLPPSRIPKSSVVIRPSTILKFQPPQQNLWVRMLRLAGWAVGGILEAAGLRAVFFTGREGPKRRTQSGW